MKILTKPEKSPLSSPRIYGYEWHDWGIWIETGRIRETVGDPVRCVTITTYYECREYFPYYECRSEEAYSTRKTWGPC